MAIDSNSNILYPHFLPGYRNNFNKGEEVYTQDIELKDLKDQSLPRTTVQEFGRGNPVMAEQTREEVDAKIAASEARGETRIAQINGKLDVLLENIRASRDENKENRRAIIANLWVIFGALIVALGAIASLAPIVFDMGSKWRETISREIQNQVHNQEFTAKKEGVTKP